MLGQSQTVLIERVLSAMITSSCTVAAALAFLEFHTSNVGSLGNRNRQGHRLEIVAAELAKCLQLQRCVGVSTVELQEISTIRTQQPLCFPKVWGQRLRL